MINHRIMVVIAVVILLTVGIFYGILPGLSMTVNTTTVNSEHGGIKGSGELIGPNNRKGFIISHTNTGFSQTITCIGRACVDTWATGGMKQYRYQVYGRPLIGDWENIGNSKYLSNPCPGARSVSGLQVGGCLNADAYSFEFVGYKYKAVKVVFEGYIDWNIANWFDDGYQWRTLQKDEAELFEGWGSLTYPIIDGKPQSTFEIGETGSIGVKTHYGGNTAENGKPWKVIMRWPKDRGGEIFKEASYSDNVDTYFTFAITEDMFDGSGSSDNSFEVEIYNTLVSKGEILVKSIDIKANAPSDVSLSGSTQAKNGETINVDLSATINSKTQLPIKSFQVSVYYGAMDTLFPSDPFSNRWILPTIHLTPTKSGDTYKYLLSFVADESGYEGFVTVSAWAYDTEGRSSLHGKKWGTYIYLEDKVPEETIEDQTGEDYDYGGHTIGWTPWDPSGGNWGEVEWEDYYPIIVAIAIFIIMLIIAFIPQIPIPMYGRMLLVILGVVLAVLTYWYMGGEF